MKKQQLKHENKDRDQLQWEVSLRKSLLTVSKIGLTSSSRENKPVEAFQEGIVEDSLRQENEKQADLFSAERSMPNLAKRIYPQNHPKHSRDESDFQRSNQSAGNCGFFHLLMEHPKFIFK